MTRKAVVLGLLAVFIIVAGGYLFFPHSQPALPPMQPPSHPALLGKSPETFFTLMAEYCKQHPDPQDTGSCAMCSQETCPGCGFVPERSQMVAACNPNSWDCAASLLFAPATGGSCAFAPTGPCQCPVGGPLKKSGTENGRRLAALVRQAPAPFSPRLAP
jgi:hypothetical protein